MKIDYTAKPFDAEKRGCVEGRRKYVAPTVELDCLYSEVSLMVASGNPGDDEDFNDLGDI